MNKSLLIKGHVISSEKCSICVPVVETSKDAIVERVKEYIAAGIYLIELRMDFFEGLENKDEVLDLLDRLAVFTENTILLFTIRSKTEGGQVELPEDYLKEIILASSATGHIDMVDIEGLNVGDAKEFVAKVKANKVAVVGSHHCFDKTYDTCKLKDSFEMLYDLGLDIVKVAMMPNEKADCLRLLSALNEFAESHEDVLVIAISMGEYGKTSRVCGGLFGSCITFASFEASSAPGQIEYEKIKTILELI